MRDLMTLSLCEFQKIIRRRKSKVALILLGIILMGMGVVYFYVENGLNISAMSGSMFSTWTLGLLMSFVLPLFAALVVADSVAGELADGTIANTYALPIPRDRIYIAKIMASIYYIMLALGLVLGMTLLIGTITSGLSTLLGSIGILAAYSKAVLALGLIIACVGYLALWLKSSSMTIVVSTLLYVGLHASGLFLGNLSKLLPTSIVGSYDKILSPNHISLLVYLICYYIILIIMGIFKFQKKEV